MHKTQCKNEFTYHGQRLSKNVTSVQEPAEFLRADKEISEKKNGFFFTFQAVTWKWIEICHGSWWVKVKRQVYTGEQTPFGRKLRAGQFWPCFGRPTSGESDQMGPVSKNMRRCKKRYSHNFWSIGSIINQRLLIGYEKTLVEAVFWLPMITV